MKKYRVIKVSTMWTQRSLTKKVEETLNEKVKEGYEIVTISFTNNRWRMPVVYITMCR
ncbi:MAG: hypothetical protein ACOYO1_16925 [Bacteroidales bacterium]